MEQVPEFAALSRESLRVFPKTCLQMFTAAGPQSVQELLATVATSQLLRMSWNKGRHDI